MKDKRYANRGQAFEEFIRFANTRYEHGKIALIEKMPTEFIPIRDRTGKICSAKVEHQSKVDFIGRYKSYPIAIEAKNTNTNTIRFDRVEPHQADYMDAFTAQPGTLGFVLISFSLKRFFAIPWTFWGQAYTERVRRGHRTSAVTVSAFGQTWTAPAKLSLSVDELAPEWEVSGHDLKYGLHYLANAERYIMQP